MNLYLRGDAFAERLRSIFVDELPCFPLEDRQHHRILIPGLSGGELQWALLGVIGQALRVRGADVTALMCDALLPACTLRKVDHYESACTRWCYRNSGQNAEAMSLPYRWYSHYLSAERMETLKERSVGMPREKLFDHSYRDIDLGLLIRKSVESFYKVGGVDLDDPAVERSARAFTAAASALVEIAEGAYRELEIDKVLLDDGKKIDWGVFRAVARRMNIPVDIMRCGIRGTSIRFETDRPPAGTALMAGWNTWKHEPLTADEDQLLEEYLRRRERVPFEYRSDKWRATLTDASDLACDLGIADRPSGSRLFAMFPNVSFDAGLSMGDEAAFPTANAWVQATVEAMARYPQHHLIVKQHPAEHHRIALDSSLDGLRDLPPNIHVIPGDTDVSASALVRLADVVLTFTSTITAEAAAIGCPVVLAGGGWHAGRGIATEVHSPADYLELIARMCTTEYLPPIDQQLARRYAWGLFFRNDIPITHMNRAEIVHVTELLIDSSADLAPGAHPSIDAICRGVLCNEPFENPHPAASLSDERSVPGAQV